MYRKEKCPNPNCSERIQRRNLDDHVENKCKYRRATCTFCHHYFFDGFKEVCVCV